MDGTTIGSRVTLLRTLSGESLAELSRLAGASHSLLSGLCSGKWDDMKARTAARLAGACGVSTDWLINGTGRSPTEHGVRAAIEAAKAQREAA